MGNSGRTSRRCKDQTDPDVGKGGGEEKEEEEGWCFVR
jgi:hypothetical protein